ncbi:hypothetical protein GCM10009122_27150 [Fulvivirga kasyanovii]|uniref:S1 motif domain-containing protein n=1 Tax=Fulvivirga kasyanovii TaxID=396812 RepID=A0ABW9RIY5_9BACT|nr:immunity 53 family protein [Fulvivirga kasyanovii]MTI24029.1 hypothetical protein [Fulvivirga kasyanovii]
MKDIIERIQNWYKLNCNGDWEHSYGYSISTLDNPGWSVAIDLAETPLEALGYKRDYQNVEKEHDWFSIEALDNSLKIYCGPDNLRQAFEIFFNEIIPGYADKDFHYELFLPLIGEEVEIWTPAKARLVDEGAVEIIEIQAIDFGKIKVRDINTIDFCQYSLEKLQLPFKVGDVVTVDIEEVYDGVVLVARDVLMTFCK